MSDTPETDAVDKSWQISADGWSALRQHARRLERERDQYRIMWERDSRSLSIAIGQRDTARAVAEDNRARYVTAESERDELDDTVRLLSKVQTKLISERDEALDALRKVILYMRVDTPIACDAFDYARAVLNKVKK